jgi:small subunit ribosomal protein S3Ae
MAKKAKKVKTVDKWRKKRYFSVLSPKLFQERELGQSMAYGPDELKGRRIVTNLMVLTGNVKKQNINVTFMINNVKGDTAYTMVEQYTMAVAAIKRKVRRQRDKLDESVKLVTKDRKSIRLKPMIITANQISRAAGSALRHAAKQFMEKYITSVDYETFVNDLVIEKFQREMRGAISKISPVKSVDVRIMKYLGEAAAAPKAAEPAEETPSAESAA